MSLLYDLFFLFYAILYLPYLVLTRRWYPGYTIRFGFFPKALGEQIGSKPNIWLHAVSVGEVMVVETLLDHLKKKYPLYQVILTVTTKTGHTLAVNRLGGKVIVIPSPLDLSFVVQKFVNLIQPKIYMAMETEIWPNLYQTLYKRNIPVIVINGRISQNSFGRYKAIRFLLKNVLNQVSLWCMQSQQDAQRIIALGADVSVVKVLGNIKFDNLGLSDAALENFPLSQEGLWWVAGSTHPGEEEMVLDVYAEIAKENPQWRLIIAPRHIERVDDILRLIYRRGFKAVKFSECGALLGKDKTIIVVDTIGHLRSLYAKASLVFIGKSLCVGGGHNIIEPAFYGKPIVIGPYMDNFKEIVAAFKEHEAIIQVNDANSFMVAVKELIHDAAKREVLGKRAKEVVEANQGATEKIVQSLAKFFP